MINVRGLANRAIQTVNPNETVTILRSDGYTVDPDTLRQIPAYVETSGPAQIQALDGKDLEQLDSLSQQGDVRSIRVLAPLAGIVRPNSQGGDLLKRKDGSVWLVVKVLETWPEWVHAAIVRQLAPT